ncbi:MAG: hypothetical protein AB1306_10600 [Nitrospirota bacterium]
MTFYNIKINKTELEKLSEDEKIFLFQLAHFLNEISILNKCFVMAGNGLTGSKDKIERHGQVALGLFFLRMLAGKLEEGWQMLQRDFFGSKLSKDYEKELPPNAIDSLNKLKRYLSSKNVIKFLRDELSFHYGKEEIKKELSKASTTETFEMFISDEATSLYAFSDPMILRIICEYLELPDVEKASKKLLDGISGDVTRWFLEFANECLLLIVKKLNIDYSKTEIPNPPLLREVKLPYFVRKDE